MAIRHHPRPDGNDFVKPGPEKADPAPPVAPKAPGRVANRDIEPIQVHQGWGQAIGGIVVLGIIVAALSGVFSKKKEEAPAPAPPPASAPSPAAVAPQNQAPAAQQQRVPFSFEQQATRQVRESFNVGGVMVDPGETLHIVSVSGNQITVATERDGKEIVGTVDLSVIEGSTQ